MSITLDELISRLEDYRDELGGEVEVRLMVQQAWPFENSVAGVASSGEIKDAAEESDGYEEDEGPEDEDPIVYIVEGDQLCYGSKAAWDVV